MQRLPTAKCPLPDVLTERDATLFHWELVKVLGLLHVCMRVYHKHTHTHRTDVDITMQTDTLTRHEQNWAQLENDSKAEGGRGEDGEGKTERTNCFCLHLKTWCANELLKENKSRVMPASSHDSHPPLCPSFLLCIHPSFAFPLLRTVSDPTPRTSWDEFTVWMSRRGGGGKVLAYAVFTVCAKIKTNESGWLAVCQLQSEFLLKPAGQTEIQPVNVSPVKIN